MLSLAVLVLCAFCVGLMISLNITANKPACDRTPRRGTVRFHLLDAGMWPNGLVWCPPSSAFCHSGSLWPPSSMMKESCVSHAGRLCPDRCWHAVNRPQRYRAPAATVAAACVQKGEICYRGTFKDNLWLYIIVVFLSFCKLHFLHWRWFRWYSNLLLSLNMHLLDDSLWLLRNQY